MQKCRWSGLMKCLILAAGYATRLYPLTKNFPKPLLKIGEKTILDWLIDDIDKSGEIDEYVLISNHKFAKHFEGWAKDKTTKISVVDDGTDSNETRLGAVKDIQFAVEKLNIDDDVLIIAGDNVLDFSLCKFIAYSKSKNTSAVMRYYEGSAAKLKKCGVATIDENDLITEMVEKPENPQSNWCCPPFYYYTSHDIKLIPQALSEGCGFDAPGSFVSWLCKQTKVHSMEMPGSRYDIGNLESYEKVQADYKGLI